MAIPVARILSRDPVAFEFRNRIYHSMGTESKKERAKETDGRTARHEQVWTMNPVVWC
jgi:hypothetical protein